MVIPFCVCCLLRIRRRSARVTLATASDKEALRTPDRKQRGNDNNALERHGLEGVVNRHWLLGCETSEYHEKGKQ